MALSLQICKNGLILSSTSTEVSLVQTNFVVIPPVAAAKRSQGQTNRQPGTSCMGCPGLGAVFQVIKRSRFKARRMKTQG